MTGSLATSEIRIRKMEITDLARVCEIDQLSFSLPWPENSFKFEILKNTAARNLVAEVLDIEKHWVIAGMSVAWLIVDEIHIATIATHPDYRQKKIGLRLMIHTLTQAAKEGAQVSFLEVRRGNEAARQMYHQLGYTEDGVRLRYYQDNHEDAILMSLQTIDPNMLESLV